VITEYIITRAIKPSSEENMEMKIQVPEQIVVVSEISRIETRKLHQPHREKGYLQAVKLVYDIEQLQKRHMTPENQSEKRNCRKTIEKLNIP
jgi:transcriptional regulator of NAD metabolism